MKQPVYILENGENVSYIPINVKTHRDAYAASLHVLFKHVADFHVCIVQTFSKKYGIPEDEILKTIQESEEFVNMKVDPVLDPVIDKLGYLEAAGKEVQVPVPVPETIPPVVTTTPVTPTVQTTPVIPTTTEPEPVVVKKRIVKKKQTDAPKVDPLPSQEPVAITEQEPVVKKRVIKKKQADVPPPHMSEPAPELAHEPTPEPPITTASVPEKKKIIRKKTIQISDEVARSDEIPKETPKETPKEQYKIQQLLAKTPNEGTIQKKIIKKK